MTSSKRGERTREHILASASRQFRARGLQATSVGEVMRDAGLTHGGFYLHFDSKTQLEAEAFSAATDVNRRRWFSSLEDTPPERRLGRLVRRYLNAEHRDHRAEGCPFASLGGEVALTGSDKIRRAYERELKRSAAALADHVEEGSPLRRMDRALAILALCIGGLMMARAVRSRKFSDRILRACRAFAESSGGDSESDERKRSS